MQLVPPEYPRPALEQEITGTVAIHVTVNAAGEVTGFNVTGSSVVAFTIEFASLR